MSEFNNQFATQKLRAEMSVTSTGATFTPGTGEQMATNKAFKKKAKTEVKDKEPKYAAGKAPNYAKEKWGWTDAKSIPNRPSKGGFQYKELWEEEIPGGKASGMTINDIAKKHSVDVQEIKNQLKKGIKVEMEHTDDKKKAAEIAMDHVSENPKYYDKLDKAGLEEIENEEKVKIVDPENMYFGRTGKVHDTNDDGTALVIVDAPRNPFTTVSLDKLKPISKGVQTSSVPDLNEAIHIGTDTKTDSNIYFEPSTGTFSINVIDAAGNRTNKLNVNTIDDVLAKFPNWKWTKAGKMEFSDSNEALEVNDIVKVVYGNEFYGRIGCILDIRRGFVIVGFMYDQDGHYIDWDESLEDDREIDVEEFSMHSSDVEKIDQEDDGIINESYSQFKNQTKTRGKSDQFHQAVREVKKKVQEINRLFEYVSRLKSELSEGEGGLKYRTHTEKALGKIKEMVSALNQNIKKFK